MRANRLYLMLVLYGAFLLVTVVGGIKVMDTFKGIQTSIASQTLDNHEELTRLNSVLGRLLENISVTQASPTAENLDKLWLELDTTYAVLHGVDLDQVKSFNAIHTEISKALKTIETMLEAPGPFDTGKASYAADRLTYTRKDLEQLYLSTTFKVAGLLKEDVLILDRVSTSIIVLLGMLLFAATLMVALLYWVRQSNKDRERSAQQFRSMVESAGDAIYIHDRYGKISAVNQVACDQTGYMRDELTGMSVAQLDAAIDFDKLRDTWDLGEADPSQYPLTLETAHQRKDGTVFPIEVRISLLPSSNGYHFVAMVRDISERKQVEKELSNKIGELNFQKYALDQHAIVSITDNAGNITYINDKFCHISGYSSEELLGQNHRILKSDEHSQEFYDDLWNTILSGKVWRGEIKNLKKGGGGYWVDASIVPFLNEQGKPFQFVAIRTDITDRVRAKEEAEKANRVKSEFLSSMSHELRTPMNAILGFGQMLNSNPKEPPTKTQKFCVDHILKGGQHLLTLINEILDLSKIEAGKVELSLEKISPTILFQDMQSLLLGFASEHGIKIIMPEVISTPPLYADYTRTKQVLLNFMTNAIKYNRKGGTVTVDILDNAEDMIKIVITDTGAGIPEDKQSGLFTAFSRLGAETTETEGTGIGLVICKQLIELMGGNLGFESEVGTGSSFWFELPVFQGSDNKIEATDADDKLGLEDVQFDIQTTILYIEDNPANMELMSMIISRIEGLSMISAHNAELGIKLAKAENPDVIILDINLPGMNGIEAVEILKRFDATRNIPVLALSAAATKTDMEKGMQAGFNQYLTKPINVNEVVSAIHNALETV